MMTTRGSLRLIQTEGTQSEVDKCVPEDDSAEVGAKEFALEVGHRLTKEYSQAPL